MKKRIVSIVFAVFAGILSMQSAAVIFAEELTDGSCQTESISDGEVLSEEIDVLDDLDRIEFLEEEQNKEIAEEQKQEQDCASDIQAGLCTIQGKQYYIQEDGEVLKNGSRSIDGIIYYFGEDGVCYQTEKKKTGWIQAENGEYYWHQEDGSILREGGWHELEGKRYFLNYGSGRRRSGWITWSKRKFYIDPESLEILTGMHQIDGKWYYFDPNSNPVGKMVTGWKTLEDGKYYFDKNGVRKKGWLTSENKKYYFEQNGLMKRGWRSIGGKKYYFDEKHGYMRKGWVTLKDRKYYFEKEGSQTRGWRSIGGKQYYFDEKHGYMHTGWLKVGKAYYYMDEQGIRCSGFHKIGGKDYYFLENGKLVYNKPVYKINGKYWSIDAKGVVRNLTMVEKMAVDALNEVGWNLKAAFDWSDRIPYYRHNFIVPDGYAPSDYYGEYGFKNRKGNCYIKAGTFYQMAKLLGYEVHQIKGYVPSRYGGKSEHSWVEIIVDGKLYVCDPSFNSIGNGYMIQYGQKGTWRYMDYYAIS